jgi:putative ABC transport system permease protein
MDEVKEKLLAGDRFTLLLYGGFALLALALAAVGIYGLMAFTVSQRTQEIGLRMALGASRNNVTSLSVGEGSILALIGLGLGIGGAVLVAAPCKVLSMIAGAGPFCDRGGDNSSPCHGVARFLSAGATRCRHRSHAGTP